MPISPKPTMSSRSRGLRQPSTDGKGYLRLLASHRGTLEEVTGSGRNPHIKDTGGRIRRRPCR